MPRSGSTLLSNILAQNSNLHVTGTSGLPNMLINFYDYWNKDPVIKITEPTSKRKTIMKQIFESYHDTDKSNIINKSRSWLILIDMLEAILQRPVKMVVTIRNINGILSSFERLYRKELRTLASTREDMEYMMLQKTRIDKLMSDTGMVGSAYNSIMNAVFTGHRNKLLPVDYDFFVRNPQMCLDAMYDFLQIPAFEHDLNNIKQIIPENDVEFGIPGLHDIKPRVEISTSNNEDMLGPYAQQFVHWDYAFLKQ